MPEKAKAVKPPGPGTQTTTVKFTSEKLNEIVVQSGGSTTKYIFANRGQIDTYGQSADDALKALKAIIPAKNADAIKNTGAPSGYYRFNLSTNSNIFLIIAWKTSVGFVFGGIYAPQSFILPGVGGGTVPDPHNAILITGDNTDIPIAKTVNINNYLNTVTVEGDVTTLCSNLTAIWQKTRDDMVSLLEPQAKDGNHYWEAKNPVGMTVESVYDASQLLNVLAMGPVLGGLAAGGQEWIQQKVGPQNKGYYLNSDGAEIAQRVMQSIDELTAITNSVKQNNDTWPSQCQKPQKLGPGLAFVSGQFIEKPSEFLAVLIDLKQKFIKAMTTNSQPPTSTEGCGSIMKNAFDPFPWLFCKVGDITHAVASAIMGKAIEWLTASIGLKGKVGFQTPAEDKNAGKVSSETPTTGTPGGTTTPVIPAPMDITVEIQFTSQAAFDTAKTGISVGHKAYVKKSAGSSVISVTPKLAEDTNGAAKTIKMNFKTTDKIPSDWTSIVIYGKATEAATTNIYRIEFGPYPPTREVKATSG